MTEVKIGRFMVGVGALIEHEATGLILVAKRDRANYNKGTWEITYGRIDQFEELEDGLRREVQEEVGITQLEVKRILRVWHFYRGQKSAETEIFGLTYHCVVPTQTVTLSDEHSEYRWVTPAEALQMIEVAGIKQDLEFFIKNKQNTLTAISNVHNEITKIY